MTVKANFDVAARIDIVIPLLNDEGEFEDHDLDMRARLIRASEGEGYFANAEETQVRDIITKHVAEAPKIIKDDDGNMFTLEELCDIPFIRNTMYQRLLDVSFNPQAAKGNLKPQ